MTFQTGDATAPVSRGAKLICHICNDCGRWGKGFVVAISKKWPQPEAAYRAWYRDRERNDFGLGAVQFVQVESEVWVANMVAQHDIQRKRVTSPDRRPPIRYEALNTALSKVAEEAKRRGASVHMPRIGCGLAGGSWEQIGPMIDRTLCSKGIEVHVYDLS